MGEIARNCHQRWGNFFQKSRTYQQGQIARKDEELAFKLQEIASQDEEISFKNQELTNKNGQIAKSMKNWPSNCKKLSKRIIHLTNFCEIDTKLLPQSLLPSQYQQIDENKWFCLPLELLKDVQHT